MRIVCMIPARLGSKRIPQKTIKMLGKKRLYQYIIDTTKQVFNAKDIYLNASENVFKDVADVNGINFYRRPIHLSRDDITNNEYIYNFIKNVKCDYLIQANITSPFITVDDIRNFLDKVKNYDCLFSVKKVKAEAVFRGDALNFGEEKINSQNLEPVSFIVWGLTGWKTSTFIENFNNTGFASFGGKHSTIGYFELKGFSTIDIDTLEDFRLAETVLKI